MPLTCSNVFTTLLVVGPVTIIGNRENQFDDSLLVLNASTLGSLSCKFAVLLAVLTAD